MDFSFPTIAVNSVAGVSPHTWKGEEDDQHPCDGTVLFTEGLLLCAARAVRRSHGVSSYSLAVKFSWLEAESTRVEVGELNPSMRL